jgi:hypothetical protein
VGILELPQVTASPIVSEANERAVAERCTFQTESEKVYSSTNKLSAMGNVGLP